MPPSLPYQPVVTSRKSLVVGQEHDRRQVGFIRCFLVTVMYLDDGEKAGRAQTLL